MKNIIINIRRITFKLLHFIGLVLKLNPKTVSVLCYHGFSNSSNLYTISKINFEKQIKIISQTSRFISLDEVVNIVKGKEGRGPAVAITIDDGFANVLEILPVIKKYKLPLTLFVLSDFQNANRKELDNEDKLLSVSKLKYLLKQGITIGCHSATHADFTKLSDDEIKKEIIDSKKNLEDKLGTKIKYFAYPKGRYDSEIVKAVKKAGYEAAFSVNPGSVVFAKDIFLLPRIIVDKTHDLSAFPSIYSLPTMFVRKMINYSGSWYLFRI